MISFCFGLRFRKKVVNLGWFCFVLFRGKVLAKMLAKVVTKCESACEGGRESIFESGCDRKGLLLTITFSWDSDLSYSKPV